MYSSRSRAFLKSYSFARLLSSHTYSCGQTREVFTGVCKSSSVSSCTQKDLRPGWGCERWGPAACLGPAASPPAAVGAESPGARGTALAPRCLTKHISDSGVGTRTLFIFTSCRFLGIFSSFLPTKDIPYTVRWQDDSKCPRGFLKDTANLLYSDLLVRFSVSLFPTGLAFTSTILSKTNISK